MINSPLGEQSKKKERVIEEDLEVMHHNLMKMYGWIPLKEFKELPLSTLFGLHNQVMKEIQKQEELRLYTLKYYGVKNPK